MPPTLLSQIERIAIGYENALSISRVTHLFESLLPWIPDAVFLIDGFDNLSEDYLQHLFSILRNLTGLLQSVGSKIALFGREVLGRGIDINTQLPGSYSINLKFVNLEADINRFVDVQVERFQLRRNLIQDPALLQQISRTLKLRGQEM